MKTNIMPLAAALSVMLAGCTTSSRVQEMIDAANLDNTTRLAAHDDSIDVLRQSAKASLEKSSDNARRLDELESRVEQLTRQVAVVQDQANASKVMSSANTVKLSELEEKVSRFKEDSSKTLSRMVEVDRLYEEVMIRQFEEIAKSAAAAIQTLRADGLTATTVAPVKLDDPIEILAPSPVVPANAGSITTNAEAAPMQ